MTCERFTDRETRKTEKCEVDTCLLVYDGLDIMQLAKRKAMGEVSQTLKESFENKFPNSVGKGSSLSVL